MKEIAISKFKAACLAVIDEVHRTGEPVRITRRGRPMAEVVPAPLQPEPGKKSWLGNMRGTVKICGDIVGPIGDEDDWECMR